MFSPCSSACSHLMIWAMPSMKVFTSVTSDFPRRSALEISQVPPVDALSTPFIQIVTWVFQLRKKLTFCAANLEAHFTTDFFEIGARWEERNFDHWTCAETSTQVWRASQNPAKMFTVHEVTTLALQYIYKQLLNLGTILTFKCFEQVLRNRRVYLVVL